MMEIPTGTAIKKRRVDFVLEASHASQIHLVGSFNDWSPQKHPMKKNGNGTWRRSVMLPAGAYECKFLVDGRWIEDPDNERRCVNCYGSLNSIVHVRR